MRKFDTVSRAEKQRMKQRGVSVHDHICSWKWQWEVVYCAVVLMMKKDAVRRECVDRKEMEGDAAWCAAYQYLS